MKRILKIAALAFVIVLSSPWRNTAAAQPSAEDEVTYQTFYDELSPHGRWIDDSEYGYVWVPNAEPNFRPYSSNGHWVYTDDFEWMWVSDYDWGWAPFHYGRWSESPAYGWFWVPGYEWSPAWVAWRDGGDYYGWAPLRPGINISINFSIGSYSPPYDYWNFAPRRYITSPRIYDHCYDRRQNVTIINQTTIINNYNYSRNVFRTGPRRNDVEIYTGRITPVRFRQSSAPGRTVFRNNEVSVYRPGVRRDDNRRFAPRSFERSNRQTGNNDNRIGRNDNRDRRSNGRFERNNGNTPNDNNRIDRNTRDNNISNRGDNNPGRRQQTNAPERRSPDVRQRSEGNNNEVIDRRRRESPERTRGAENNRQPDDGRMYRRQEQPNNNTGNPNNGNRSVERQPQPRSFERNNQPQVREQRQPQVREQRQPQPQMREQRQQPQVREQRQEAPRQFERRDNSGSRGGNDGGNRGNRGRGGN